MKQPAALPRWLQAGIARAERKPRPRRPNIADMMKAFGCIDAMLARLADGWIHEIQGAAVFKNPQDGVWYEIPAAMEGWVALWERLDARYDLLLDLAPARRSRPSWWRSARRWWISASGRIGGWMCTRSGAW